MDTEPIFDNVACAGYGAINVITRLLSNQLGTLAARIRQGDHSTTDVFLATADGMTAAIESIHETPVWGDARTQILAFIGQYRDFIGVTSTHDRVLIESALADVLETNAILTIARDRLARRLGFATE